MILIQRIPAPPSLRKETFWRPTDLEYQIPRRPATLPPGSHPLHRIRQRYLAKQLGALGKIKFLEQVHIVRAQVPSSGKESGCQN
ncbi:hypothetical protein TNCV_2082041 [Trichonephila clavipes]|nr:hypothetical protein TNCV_2082041 [Trichonephila clavipes]